MFDLPILRGPAGEVMGWILNNGLLVAAMVLLVALVSPIVRRPELVHVLWSATLIKLFTPALLVISIPVARQVTSATGPGLSAAELAALAELQGSASPAWWVGRESVLLLALWLVGAAAVGLLIWTRQRRWDRLTARAMPADRALRQRVEGLAERLGLTDVPDVRVLDAVMSPAVVGPLFSRARLILPRNLIENLKSAELDAVIVHELAHLKRRDPWIRRLEMLAVTAYWWNPAVHWARRRLRQWEEMSCDLAVLRALPEHRKAYAHALITTLEHVKTGAQPMPITAHGLGSPHTWKERLHMIMLQDAASPSKLSRRLVWLLAAALVAFSPLMVGADAPESAESTGAASATVSDEGAEDAVSTAAVSTETQYTGEPISMELKEAPLTEVLRSFAAIADVNMVIHPDVKGSVTVNLKAVPWDQALEQILQVNGLAMDIDGRVIRIEPVAVAQARLQGAAEKHYSGQPISMSLKRANLREVLDSFAKIGGLEMYVSPDVEGEVTVELKSVPWDQALDEIVAAQGLEMRIEDKLVHIAKRSDD